MHDVPFISIIVIRVQMYLLATGEHYLFRVMTFCAFSDSEFQQRIYLFPSTVARPDKNAFRDRDSNSDLFF